MFPLLLHPSQQGAAGPMTGQTLLTHRIARRLRSFHPSLFLYSFLHKQGASALFCSKTLSFGQITNKKRCLVPSTLSLFSWFPFDVWEVLPDCSPEFPAIMKFGEDRRYTLTTLVYYYYFLNWKASKLWKNLL